MADTTEQHEQTDFEATLQRLETLAGQLESGELSLEASMTAFEDGIKLTRQAQKALAEAEQKVQLLTAGENGPESTPLTLDEEATDA